MTDDPLNKLYPSSANVRKTGAKDGIEGVAQSIHNHGLLNNLAVQPGGEKETFSVLAGGRRLAALNHLAKAKLIPADWGVPCNEIEIEIEGDIPSEEISLAETKCARPCIPPISSRRSRSWPTGQGRDTIAAKFGELQEKAWKALGKYEREDAQDGELEVAATPKAKDPTALTSSLAESLTTQRTAALQARLATNTKVAFVAIVHRLAIDSIRDGDGESIIQISPTDEIIYADDSPDMKGSAALAEMQEEVKDAEKGLPKDGISCGTGCRSRTRSAFSKSLPSASLRPLTR